MCYQTGRGVALDLAKTMALLDYAAQLVLLHKVGGGYIFVHRMLMEYFAALEAGAEIR